jgi:hypothetical protein
MKGILKGVTEKNGFWNQGVDVFIWYVHDLSLQNLCTSVIWYDISGPAQLMLQDIGVFDIARYL